MSYKPVFAVMVICAVSYYALSCIFSRPLFDGETRFIDLGNKQCASFTIKKHKSYGEDEKLSFNFRRHDCNLLSEDLIHQLPYEASFIGKHNLSTIAKVRFEENCVNVSTYNFQNEPHLSIKSVNCKG